MTHRALFLSAILFASVPFCQAADYQLETAAEPAPTGDFADEILAQIGDSELKVAKGKRLFLEFWPAKQWAVKQGFQADGEVTYPFEPGQLIGVARFKSKGTDFRGQEIKPGLYTVRSSLQPVDGNHVGTAPTRDFFLLLPAASDQSPAPLTEETLFKASAEVAGAAHPAILYLRPGAAAGESTLEHDEEAEWWTLSFTNPTNGDPLPVRLVVVGQAKE